MVTNVNAPPCTRKHTRFPDSDEHLDSTHLETGTVQPKPARTPLSVRAMNEVVLSKRLEICPSKPLAIPRKFRNDGDDGVGYACIIHPGELYANLAGLETHMRTNRCLLSDFDTFVCPSHPLKAMGDLHALIMYMEAKGCVRTIDTNIPALSTTTTAMQTTPAATSYSCPKHKETFPDLPALQAHLKSTACTYQNYDGNYNCPVHDKTCNTVALLRSHMINKGCVAYICGDHPIKVFTNVAVLHDHRQKQGCGEWFKFLYDDTEDVEVVEDVYSCSKHLTTQKFSDYAAFAAHFRAQRCAYQNDDGTYTCPLDPTRRYPSLLGFNIYLKAMACVDGPVPDSRASDAQSLPYNSLKAPFTKANLESYRTTVGKYKCPLHPKKSYNQAGLAAHWMAKECFREIEASLDMETKSGMSGKGKLSQERKEVYGGGAGVGKEATTSMRELESLLGGLTLGVGGKAKAKTKTNMGELESLLSGMTLGENTVRRKRRKGDYCEALILRTIWTWILPRRWMW